MSHLKKLTYALLIFQIIYEQLSYSNSNYKLFVG